MPKRFKFRLFSIIPTFQSCRSKDLSNLPLNPTPSSLLNCQRNNLLSSDSDLPNHRPTSVTHRCFTVPFSSSTTTSIGCSRLRSHFRFPRRRRCSFSHNRTLCKDDDKYYYKWEKDDKWHVITVNLNPHSKFCSSGTGTHPASDQLDEKIVVIPSPMLRSVKWGSWKRKRSTAAMSRIRKSTCTSTTRTCDGLYSDDLDVNDDGESETLVSNSSKSFWTTTATTDYSTELRRYLETIRIGPEGPASNSNGKRRIKKSSRRRITIKISKRGVVCEAKRRFNQKRRRPGMVKSDLYEENKSSQPRLSSSPPPPSPVSVVPGRVSLSETEELGSARLSLALQRLIPCDAEDETGIAVVEGKVRESYAVVKRSEDPYEDFRRSIMEMIVEKGIAEESDLEEMLRCLLSLNAERHREVILHAFVDVWAMLFFSGRV